MKEAKKIGFVILLCLWAVRAFAGDDKWNEVLDLEGKWKFSIGDNKQWAESNFDDSDWEKIRVPDDWEDQGFHGFDGYAWYRIKFDGRELDRNAGALTLFLGYIDDIDETFFNGRKIGQSGSFPPVFKTAYNANRQYLIPDELINYNGENVIAVRVFDAMQYGGITDGPIGIYSNEEDKELIVNLRGVWNFKKIPNWKMGQDPNLEMLSDEKEEWMQIMVPSAWEHQGYDFNGGAIYHKLFKIPEQFKGETFILILGAIDDKDWAYLNGKPIGQTDGYKKLRAYTITPDMYDTKDLNVLTIYIEDSTGEGGITHGPVGIMRQTDFTRFMRWR